jgi:hypothetical protein
MGRFRMTLTCAIGRFYDYPKAVEVRDVNWSDHANELKAILEENRASKRYYRRTSIFRLNRRARADGGFNRPACLLLFCAISSRLAISIPDSFSMVNELRRTVDSPTTNSTAQQTFVARCDEDFFYIRRSRIFETSAHFRVLQSNTHGPESFGVVPESRESFEPLQLFKTNDRRLWSPMLGYDDLITTLDIFDDV